MLAPPDAELVERERSLPGMGLLLDPDAMTTFLSELSPGSNIERAQPRYVRYKPVTSCMVAYDVTVDGTLQKLYARCHRHDRVHKAVHAMRRHEEESPLGWGIAVEPDLALAVFAFPNDYEIPTLRKLFDDRRASRLRRIMPAHADLKTGDVTCIRYKPERRYVGRVDVDGEPRASVRLYPPSQFAIQRERSWAFSPGGPLRVAQVIGDSERYSALAHEWVPGPALQYGATAWDPDHARVLADSMVAMHRQRPRLRTMYTPDDYCQMLHGTCESVVAVQPQLRDRIDGLYAEIYRGLMGRSWRSQAVHGDLTADQFIDHQDSVTVLDFDRAGYGDPIMDVGTFAAGLVRGARDGALLEDAIRASSTIAAAYWDAAGYEDVRAFRLFTAGALMLAALEPFRLREPDWPEHMVWTVEQAGQALLEEFAGAR